MIRRLSRDERAATAVEFAFIGPLVAYALFGMISAFLEERALMKLSATAQAIADMAAQSMTVTTASLADYCLAGKLIMTPDNATGTTAGSHLALSFVTAAYQTSASPHIFIPGSSSAWNMGWNNNPAQVAINSGSSSSPSFTDNCAAISTSGSGTGMTITFSESRMFSEGGENGINGDPSTNTVLAGTGTTAGLLTADGQQVVVARAVFTFYNPFALYTSSSLLALNHLTPFQVFASPISMTAYAYATPARGSLTCQNSNPCATGC